MGGDGINKHVINKIELFADFLPLILCEDLPVFEKQFYAKLDNINTLTGANDRANLIRYFSKICSTELDKGIMLNRSRNKPLGYPGDYLLIDWIYTKKTSSDYVGKLWDGLFHRTIAANAVRNRKDFFCKLINSMDGQISKQISVLNLASGSCRELYDAINKSDSMVDGSLFHCIDMEKEATKYASELLGDILAKFKFEWMNINVLDLRKITSNIRYDLIWAAGLFDYLNDRFAINLLRRLWELISCGGKIVFGNFHPLNPSRNFMEWCLEWPLIYRAEEDLYRLCNAAGIPRDCVQIKKEPLGVCLFCDITRTN